MASLDALRVSLREAEFEAVAGSSGRRWAGPLPEEMWDLTAARVVQVEVRDGWPHLHPHVYVEGLPGDHVSAHGLVCLWSDDDVSMRWLNWEMIRARLLEWAQASRGGFAVADAGLDAHLGFESRSAQLATFDLRELLREPDDGDTRQLRGVPISEASIDLRPGPPRQGELVGRWFYRAALGQPPRTLEEFEGALTPDQLKQFFSLRKRSVGTQDPKLAALIWGRHGGHDALVLLLGGDGTATSLEPAPRDTATLRMRSGRDWAVLARKRVVVFGLGAVGSQAAVLLAASGVGWIVLVDGDRLRPGNVVRHACGPGWVGHPKVRAVGAEIAARAPWTEVEEVIEYPHGPTAVGRRVSGADLVVDCTGHASFSAGLADSADRHGVPLVAATLFRAGAVGRVARQMPGGAPLYQRGPTQGFVRIPPSVEEEPLTLETGCSAPVNLAPPASVTSLAALTARAVVDTLTGRFEYPTETVEVFSPLDSSELERVGQVAR